MGCEHFPDVLDEHVTFDELIEQLSLVRDADFRLMMNGLTLPPSEMCTYERRRKALLRSLVIAHYLAARAVEVPHVPATPVPAPVPATPEAPAPKRKRGPGVEINLGHRSFPTKGAAIAHFSEMLERSSPEHLITSGPDFDDLLAILRFPGGKSIKEGPGVRGFFKHAWVDKPTGSEYHVEYVGFWVLRIDGTSTDFSFQHPIHNYRGPHAAK
jgi:hypothetical protein